MTSHQNEPDADPLPLNTFEGSLEDQPLHIVVSSFKGATWIKPSRPCSRLVLIGLLTEAIYMAQVSTCKTVDPADCPLRVFISVDDDQPDLDALEEDSDRG